MKRSMITTVLTLAFFAAIWSCSSTVTNPITSVDFVASQTPGTLLVRFNPTVTGGEGRGDQYDWDFGDGGTSTEDAPIHEYAAPGTFVVRMSVCPDQKSSSRCAEISKPIKVN